MPNPGNFSMRTVRRRQLNSQDGANWIGRAGHQPSRLIKSALSTNMEQLAADCGTEAKTCADNTEEGSKPQG